MGHTIEGLGGANEWLNSITPNYSIMARGVRGTFRKDNPFSLLLLFL